MGSRILSYFKDTFTWSAAMILLFSQLLFPFLVFTTAEAADSGTHTPSSTHTPNNWDVNTVANLQTVSDILYVTDDDGSEQGYDDFGISIPAGSLINGIVVSAVAASTDNNGCRLGVALSWNNGSNYTSYDYQNLSNVIGPGNEAAATKVFGANNDNWGRTWQAAEFNDGNFVLKIQDNDPGGSCTNDATTFVDYLGVKVFYTSPDDFADLSITKTNNVGGAITTGNSFTWTLTVTNTGNGPAVFSNNQDVIQDNLPDSNDTSYSPTNNIPVVLAGGTTGGLDCDIDNGDNLDCDADGTLTIPSGGSLSLVFTATPDSAGTYNNPRGGNNNVCVVDPDGYITEANEGNNSCSDSVVVADVLPVANPALSQACGLDIALVLDNSTSIDSTEMTAMKNAMTAFVNALAGTPTEFSVSRFADSGAVLQTFTADTVAVNAAINGVPIAGGFTNWEDGLDKAQSTLSNRTNPDLVVFASDGDPTTSTTVGGTDTGQPNAHLTPAVVEANSIKTGGARILAIGIGDPTVSRLSAISGPNVNTGSVLTSDVITTDFASLAADLADFATQTCGGTVTIEKLVDIDGDLQTTDDQSPAQGWDFSVTGNGLDAKGTTDAGGLTPAIEVDPATGYAVTETVQDGYTVLSATCEGATNNGSFDGSAVTGLQIAANDIVTCTFINAELEGTLILEKTVVNDDGGTLTQASFPVKIDGVAVAWGSHTVEAGNYTVSETNQAGYEAGLWGGDCDAQGNVTVPAGETVTCTITNDDIPATVKVVKYATNDNGGTTQAEDFNVYVDGGDPLDVILAGSNGTSSSAAFETVEVMAGVSHTVSEDDVPGYANTYISCFSVTNEGTQISHPFTPELGEYVLCNVGNNDIAPTLTVTKVVTDNWGGGLTVSDFPLYVDGQLVVSGVSVNLNAGDVVVTEDGNSGYVLADVAGDCNILGEITLTIGETYTCTLYNNDLPAIVKVTKHVQNDDGGSAGVSDFDLFINGAEVNHGAENMRNGNAVMTISEQMNVPGYTQTGITCSDVTDKDNVVNVGNGFTSENGHYYECAVNNDDESATLQLKKTVINDDGGNNVAGDWTLTAQGQNTTYIDSPGVKGGDTMVVTQQVDVLAGDPISLSESGPTGYQASDWNCDGGNFDNDQLYIGLGENVVCEIVNDDKPASVKIVKIARNDDGGETEAKDFDLYINGRSLGSNQTAAGTINSTDTYATYDLPAVDSNKLYTLSEDIEDGYELEAIACFVMTRDGEKQIEHPFTPSEGEQIVCKLLNNDKPAKVTLIKKVINDDGGKARQDQWLLRADGPTTLEGRDNTYSLHTGYSAQASAGWYYLSEVGNSGYELTGIRCNGQWLDINEPRIEVGNGEHVKCVFYNDDIPPTLHLEKVAISVNHPVEQEFELGAWQDRNGFDSPYTVDVNPDTYDVESSVKIDGDDGLDAGWVKVYEEVPRNWKLGEIFCHPTEWGDNLISALDGEDYVNQNMQQRSDGTWVKLRPGDDVTCTFVNFEKAKVTVTKFWDVDQDGKQDEGEATLPDWTFELERCRGNLLGVGSVTQNTDEDFKPIYDSGCDEDRDIDSVSSLDHMYGRSLEGTTGGDGTVVFRGLAPFGHYVLSEQFQDGWNISGIRCEYTEGGDGAANIYQPNRYDIYTLPGAEIECFVGNYPDGQLVIEKTNNRIGDSLVDGDVVDYTITVTNPQTSGVLYETVTYDLLPENIIYVSASGVATSSTRGILASPLDGLDYVADGPASWELGDMIPGEVVTLTYSAIVANDTEPGIYENIAFVEGWACSYQGVGYFPIPEPTESLTLNTLDNQLVPSLDDEYEDDHEQDNPCPFGTERPCGEYKDTAVQIDPCDCNRTAANVLAPCEVREAASPAAGFATLVSVLGNQVNGEGDPFVESAVTVVDEPETQGFVLGVQTEILANTGTPAILPPLIGLIVAGAALMVSSGRGRKGKLFNRITSATKHLVVALALVVTFSGSAMAATGSNWQLNVVDLPDSTSSSEIEIAYQVASVDATDTFGVTLWQNGVMVDSEAVGTSYGDNGSFTVSDLAEGSYEFTLVADNSGDAADKRNTQTIVVDTTKPASVKFDGSIKSGNNYAIKFTVPAGSDAKTVNIFASTSKEFVAGSSTLVGSVDATPGTEQVFNYTASDDSTRYFAIEVVDGAGNASALVGDSETVVTGGSGTSSALISAGSDTSSAGGSDGSAVLGEDDGTDTATSTNGDEEANQNEDSSSSRIWIALGVLALAIAGYVFRQRTSTSE